MQVESVFFILSLTNLTFCLSVITFSKNCLDRTIFESKGVFETLFRSSKFMKNGEMKQRFEDVVSDYLEVT